MKERDEIQDFIFYYQCGCKNCKHKAQRNIADQFHYHILKYHTEGELYYFSPVYCVTDLLRFLEDFHLARHNINGWKRKWFKLFRIMPEHPNFKPDYFERTGFRLPS